MLGAAPWSGWIARAMLLRVGRALQMALQRRPDECVILTCHAHQMAASANHGVGQGDKSRGRRSGRAFQDQRLFLGRGLGCDVSGGSRARASGGAYGGAAGFAAKLNRVESVSIVQLR